MSAYDSFGSPPAAQWTEVRTPIQHRSQPHNPALAVGGSTFRKRTWPVAQDGIVTALSTPRAFSVASPTTFPTSEPFDDYTADFAAATRNGESDPAQAIKPVVPKPFDAGSQPKDKEAPGHPCPPFSSLSVQSETSTGYVKASPDVLLIPHGQTHLLHQHMGGHHAVSSARDAQQYQTGRMKEGSAMHRSPSGAGNGWSKIDPAPLGGPEQFSGFYAPPRPQNQQQHQRTPVPSTCWQVLPTKAEPQHRHPQHEPSRPFRSLYVRPASQQTPNQPVVSSAFQQLSAPLLRENERVARKRQCLTTFSSPPYHVYPVHPNSALTQSEQVHYQPLQGHLPPHMMPDHPVFLYIGRDLSAPAFDLARFPNGPFLFKRNIIGNMTDYGFGAGVEIVDEVKQHVAEEEDAAVKHYLRCVAKDGALAQKR